MNTFMTPAQLRESVVANNQKMLARIGAIDAQLRAILHKKLEEAAAQLNMPEDISALLPPLTSQNQTAASKYSHSHFWKTLESELLVNGWQATLKYTPPEIAERGIDLDGTLSITIRPHEPLQG